MRQNNKLVNKLQPRQRGEKIIRKTDI